MSLRTNSSVIHVSFIAASKNGFLPERGPTLHSGLWTGWIGGSPGFSGDWAGRPEATGADKPGLEPATRLHPSAVPHDPRSRPAVAGAHDKWIERGTTPARNGLVRRLRRVLQVQCRQVPEIGDQIGDALEREQARPRRALLRRDDGPACRRVASGGRAAQGHQALDPR